MHALRAYVSKFLWSVSVFFMNCSKYLQNLSDCVNQKAWFHFKWYFWFYKGSWTLMSRTLQPTLRTLQPSCRCYTVKHCQVDEINQLFKLYSMLLWMKLVGPSCKSHEISQNSFGDTTCFLHEDHRKKLKGNKERYA